MKITRKELTRRLDQLRQTCARYEGAKKVKGEWVNTCVTCGKTLPCNKQSGGHFIGRGCHPLRWDEKNVHCQCNGCNMFRNGAYIEYSQWFIKRYGLDTFNKYVDTYERWKAGKIPAFKMNELQQIYDYWLKEGRELEKKIGEKKFPASWDFFGEDYLDYNPTNN